MSEERQREGSTTDRQGMIRYAKISSRTFWDWVEHHHVDRLAVIVLTLYLTFDVIQWAKDFADAHPDGAGGNTALIIGAVLGPWGLLQAALFKFYTDAKAKSNGPVKP